MTNNNLEIKYIQKRRTSDREAAESNILTTHEENLSTKDAKLNKVDDGHQENDNQSNEETITIKDDVVKRHRKSKKETKGRNFVCQNCSKSYLSYPALYTHKRNKHNIIPITGKPNIFKTGNANSVGKFKYNMMDSYIDVKGLTDRILKSFGEISKKFYLNPSSFLYNPVYRPENDQFMNLLKFYNNSNLDKIKVPKYNENGKTTIDNILAIYLILLTEVTRDKKFSDLIIKFVFLFREYLNLTGWEYLKYLQEYLLIGSINICGEFCSFSNCEEIPEMINDFVIIFLEMEDEMTKDKKEITDITQNFCYWLFINGLTNYKLARLANVNE